MRRRVPAMSLPPAPIQIRPDSACIMNNRRGHHVCLGAHDVSIDDVIRAAGDGVSLQPGGFLDTPNQRLSITHAAAVRSVRDLESIVVAARKGSALRIGDVATVIEGSPPPVGDAAINAGRGLLLIVEKQLGAKHPAGDA